MDQSPTAASEGHVDSSTSVADPEGSLSIGSSAFIEGLYSEYLRDASSVSADWRVYFDQLFEADHRAARPARSSGVSHEPVFSPGPGRFAAPPTTDRRADMAILQERVDQLIRSYRARGHVLAAIDPLGQPRSPTPELDPVFYGLTQDHMDLVFSTTSSSGPNTRTLREILQWLRTTYCRSIGAQFMHIDELSVRQWLQDRMEETENRIILRRDEQLRILKRLTEAVVFEDFLQKKYLGTKSFSLEGAESLIPLLDLAIEKCSEQGVQEVVLGMAHRGRLNVLANVMGKRARDIFREFEDVDPQLHVGRGDVKYHLGYSSDWLSEAGRKIHVSLCFNPSHLEYVNTVVQGRVRAKQDRTGDCDRRRGIAILIHGDAAFAGEGVVQETLNLSQLPAFAIGGTLHVVVNNQLGFTTCPSEGRSSTYATDVAKMLQIPIFHVNGEDAEAVAQVVRLALDFRAKFQRDVVIDMYCYRLRGHNETDEPSFTQPLMYRAIKQRKPVREAYLEHLLKLGGISREEADRIAQDARAHLEIEIAAARSADYSRRPEFPSGVWNGYRGGIESSAPEVDTSVPIDRLRQLLEQQTKLPASFHPHPKIESLLQLRQKMAQGLRPLDWAAAEALAYASLVTDGVRVRLCGQDSERGTFSHRHAVYHDTETGEKYAPLQHLSNNQAPIDLINSPLSEAGVLGFEYGYSLDTPDGLILWEGQFGDFSNCAQVIIDQFIVSAEDKWRRLSGITLLLPHGFEGAGPEHSSARLERFLQLAAVDNIQVVNITTPAQFFHCLRRQALRPWRKPLVVMTPKSLLRHPQAISSLEQLSEGRFRRVLPDERPEGVRRTSRVLMCSGKLYYELLKLRDETGRDDVAIYRVEELYPLPTEILKSMLVQYPDGTPVYWVQEEPENMGAWRFLYVHFGKELFGRLPFAGICRPASGSPATGSGTSHKLEQEQLITTAFGEGRSPEPKRIPKVAIV